MGLILGSQPDPFGGIQFLENATQDYDYGVHTGLPTNFGSGEFTLKIVGRPYQITDLGDVETSPSVREDWATNNDTIYGTSEWWFWGNFLLDGHNNNNFANGTNSIQVFNSGQVRWLFGDGSATIPTGDVWGIQNASGTSILTANRFVLHLVREFSGVSDSDLMLYINGTLQNTETSDVRTNMWTSYWQSWTGFPGDENGWFWGSEKQAALNKNGVNDFPDYKGLLEEVVFYDDALSAAEITADQGVVDTGHADYMDHFAFGEGSGATTTSENSIAMTLNNSPSSFWP